MHMQYTSECEPLSIIRPMQIFITILHEINLHPFEDNRMTIPTALGSMGIWLQLALRWLGIIRHI